MAELKDYTDEDLLNELRERGKEVLTEERRCAGCNTYNARYIRYSSHCPEWHCNGCNRPENSCTCR